MKLNIKISFGIFEFDFEYLYLKYVFQPVKSENDFSSMRDHAYLILGRIKANWAQLDQRQTICWLTDLE